MRSRRSRRERPLRQRRRQPQRVRCASTSSRRQRTRSRPNWRGAAASGPAAPLARIRVLGGNNAGVRPRPGRIASPATPSARERASHRHTVSTLRGCGRPPRATWVADCPAATWRIVADRGGSRSRAHADRAPRRCARTVPPPCVPPPCVPPPCVPPPCVPPPCVPPPCVPPPCVPPPCVPPPCVPPPCVPPPPNSAGNGTCAPPRSVAHSDRQPVYTKWTRFL